MSEAAKPLSAARERLPDRRDHVLINFTAPDGFRYTAGLGYFENCRLAEIFLNAEKIGTAIARDSAVVASLALQHGVPRRRSAMHSLAMATAPRPALSAPCSTCWLRRGGHDPRHTLYASEFAPRYRSCTQGGPAGDRYPAGRHAHRLIPDRIDISERPTIVARKARLGDWEGDTVVSAGQPAGTPLGRLGTRQGDQLGFLLAVENRGHLNRMRAFSRRFAGLLPLRIRACNCSRSSVLSRTT